jgi:hypothetical protein
MCLEGGQFQLLLELLALIVLRSRRGCGNEDLLRMEEEEAGIVKEGDMTAKHLSRRRFLQGVGTVAAATVLAERAPRLTVARAAAAATGTARFGIQTPPQHVTYRDIVSVWQEADEMGFDTAFLFDHFIPIYSDPNGPCFRPVANLSRREQRMRS